MPHPTFRQRQKISLIRPNGLILCDTPTGYNLRSLRDGRSRFEGYVCHAWERLPSPVLMSRYLIERRAPRRLILIPDLFSCTLERPRWVVTFFSLRNQRPK